MTTLQLTATPFFVDGKLALGPLSLQPAGAVTSSTANEIVVELPASDSLVIRLLGTTSSDGRVLAIAASAGSGTQAFVPWDRVGADAVSDPYSGPGDLKVNFGPATQGATTTTVTVRINKGGRPDNFLLDNFPPR